jgi:aminodeoxyfutalosine synthase
VTSSLFDQYVDRLAANERLSQQDIRELASTPDILQLGMLADTLRRQLHGNRATFLRVASVRFDASFSDAVPPTAREIRITGSPDTIEIARTVVQTAREVAGERTVSAFSWADIERLSGDQGVGQTLNVLRQAGLDALAELPIDQVADLRAAIRELAGAGFSALRLSVSRSAADERIGLFAQVGDLQDEFGIIRALDPLPTMLNTFRPTTGYEDVKMVAVARLAAPAIRTIQVDWQRYGPKLAQVALTFGADDIDGIAGSDDAPEGRRRAPLEEIRRNIEAAGFEPVERNGGWTDF